MPIVKKQTGSVKKPQPAPPKKSTTPPVIKPTPPATPAPKQPVKSSQAGAQAQSGHMGTSKPNPQAALAPTAKVPLPKATPMKPTKPQLTSGKPALTPVSLRYEQELLNNPMLKKIDRKMKEHPDLFGAVLRASDSPEKAFNKMFAMWGKDEELDAKALKFFSKHDRTRTFQTDGEDGSDPVAEAENIISEAPSLIMNWDIMSDQEREEIVDIITRMRSLNLDVELSSYNPKMWSLSDLQLIDQTLNAMSETANSILADTFSNRQQEIITSSVAWAGASQEDAGLWRLLNGNNTLTFYRDAGVETENGNSVAYAGSSSDRSFPLWQVLERSDGKPNETWNPLSPETDPRLTGVEGTVRDAVWYGQAAPGGIILGDSAFNVIDRDPTSNGLIAHEVSHIILFGAGVERKSILDTTNLVLTENARSSSMEFELQADILANGFLGLLSPDSDYGFGEFVSGELRSKYASIQAQYYRSWYTHASSD